QSGAHRQPTELPRLLKSNFARRQGPWPDDAHIPAKHIDKLRKLVQGKLSQKPADGRDARVVAHLKNWACSLILLPQQCLEFLGVDDHGAKLEHLETAAIEPHANLAKKNRTRGSDLDYRRQDEQEWRKQQQRNGGGDDIEQPLDCHLMWLQLKGLIVQVAVADGFPCSRTRALETEVVCGEGKWNPELFARADGGLHGIVMLPLVSGDIDSAYCRGAEHGLQIVAGTEQARYHRGGAALVVEAQTAHNPMVPAPVDFHASEPPQGADADDEHL